MDTNNKTLNFLYCFDYNYNSQAYSSIISLLDLVNEKIHIHILHNDLEKIKNIPEKIKSHKYLDSINTYEFKNNGIDFPNIDDTHISEATYYRLFIDEYLPNNIQNIVYIDADIICLKNPIEAIKEKVEILNNSNFVFCAKTEYRNNFEPAVLKEKMTNSFFKKYWPFERLNINEVYFNAGFLIINLNRWRENNLTFNFLKEMDKIKNNIVAWDQDVMNSYINGQYIDLSIDFNCLAEKINKLSKIPYFLHFSGSKKPWNTDGTFNYEANFYHKNYSKVHDNYFHISHNWKTNSIKQWLWSLISLSIFKLKKPLKYCNEFLRSLIK